MLDGREVSHRFPRNRFIYGGPPISSWHFVPDVRYRHILVVTDLSQADRAAIRTGFELALLHQATLTLLHAQSNSHANIETQGLDSIGLLRLAAEKLRDAPTGNTTDTPAPSMLSQFVREVVPQRFLHAVNWQAEFRGDLNAKHVAIYANESDVGLVVLPIKPSRWWLPKVGWNAQAIQRLARANVIEVRDQPQPLRS